MLRITLSVIAGVLTFIAVLANVAMGARAIEQAEQFLFDERFNVLFAEATRSIERSLQLGIPLTELNQAQQPLERLVRLSSDILSADVVSLSSVTLHSTDRGAVGEQIPEAWLNAQSDPLAQRRGRWIAEESGTVTIGNAIRNDFGQIEGWLAVMLRADFFTRALRRVPELLQQSLPMALGAALVAGFVGLMIGRREENHINSASDNLMKRKPPTNKSPLYPALLSAIDKSKSAETGLDFAERRLREIDEQL